MSDEGDAHTPALGARSIAAFCAANNICRATFYNHPDEMPDTIYVGSRRLVPFEAELAWQRKRRRAERARRAASTKSERRIRSS